MISFKKCYLCGVIHSNDEMGACVNCLNDGLTMSSRIKPVTYYRTSDKKVWESWSLAYDHEKSLHVGTKDENTSL